MDTNIYPPSVPKIFFWLPKGSGPQFQDLRQDLFVNQFCLLWPSFPRKSKDCWRLISGFKMGHQCRILRCFNYGISCEKMFYGSFNSRGGIEKVTKSETKEGTKEWQKWPKGNRPISSQSEMMVIGLLFAWDSDLVLPCTPSHPFYSDSIRPSLEINPIRGPTQIRVKCDPTNIPSINHPPADLLPTRPSADPLQTWENLQTTPRKHSDNLGQLRFAPTTVLSKPSHISVRPLDRLHRWDLIGQLTSGDLYGGS